MAITINFFRLNRGRTSHGDVVTCPHCKRKGIDREDSIWHRANITRRDGGGFWFRVVDQCKKERRAA